MSSQASAKRSFLTVSQKINIIRELESESPPSKRKLARDKSVSESVIRRVWQNRENIILKSSTQSDGYNRKKKRLSKPKFEEMENKLLQWITVSYILLLM